MEGRISYFIGSPVAIRRRVFAIHGDVSVATRTGLTGVWYKSVFDVGVIDCGVGVVSAKTGTKARHLLVRRGDHEINAGGVCRRQALRIDRRLDDRRNATAA